ncbi:UDP-glucose 4-epimerase [Pseudobythopirellula maris]|uniref:UDP-glucose 4-epimerase n=1 Tax=Pseudobythopirellula maris TaxID=2527991 RepID=A0A5C5ZN03_9BACT|nr:SDR family oxidoreductase [Pseudobythopirellula maris]TWT88445.1 UDP-glucose 4-epimerase [Pseudobythopirellula maris]
MALHLVTGGAGFIGSHIATKLVERGDTVRVLDNLLTGFRKNLDHLGDRVEFVEGSVTDPAAVARAVDGAEVVYHEAAIASVPRSVANPLESHGATATGVVTVLEAARTAGVRRVVFAASSAAYGDRPTPVKSETDPVDPLSPYAAAKLAGEAYCMAYSKSMGLDAVALRYFNVYGPRQDPHSEYSAVIPIFVTKMLAGERPHVFGDGGQSRDFVFVEDVARANLLAADAPQAAGQVINVATGERVSLLDLIAAINAALGSNIEPVFDPPRAGDVRESLADIGKARELLGYEPSVAFAEGLKRSIDYYRAIAGQ